jgi:hypothetical protein
MSAKLDLLLRGMQGFGDNIHQRGLVLVLKTRFRVWLETSSPWVYHDLFDDDFRVVLPERPPQLRTQTEERARQHDKYSPRLAHYSKALNVWYRPDDVRRLGSVFASMCASVGVDHAAADFRLPAPEQWRLAALEWLNAEGWDLQQPIMVTRPLIERPADWTGCIARNPDFDAYHELYGAIRNKFFVVSIAKLKHDVEWQVGHRYETDVQAHAGELTFETIAGIVDLAAMSFGSPGYLIPLSQALGRPVVCVFGGYENGSSFSAGARFAPYLPIEPIDPCNCWRHDHACKKAIDLPLAKSKLIEFANAAISDCRAA